MSFEIQLVEAADQGWFGAFASFSGKDIALLSDELFKGAIQVRSFSSALQVLSSKSAQNSNSKFDSITINGHGNNTGFRFGKEDWVSLQSIQSFREEFRQLGMLMSPNGVLVISSCRAGENAALLIKVSQMMGNKVVMGYTDLQMGGFAPSGVPVITDSRGTYSPAAPAGGSQPRSAPPP